MFRNYQVPNAPVAYVPDFSVPPPNFYPTNQLFPSNEFFELELNSWLSQIKTKKPKQHKKLNVSSIKTLLTKYFKLIKELEKLLLYLKVGEASLEEDDWNNKCSEIEKKKKELNEIVEKFDDPDFLAAVKFSTNRAKKKRAQRKKKRLAWKEKKNERDIFRSQEHKRIDVWLENKQFEIEKVKREESVKREADLVLSDVRLKTSEAKKTLALLNALEKLRSVRVRQRLANGKRVFEEETKSFTQVIEKLKKLWTEQLEEYKQEETGLQVMLNDAEVERKNVELAKLKKIAHQWTDVIFGKRDKLPHFLQLNSFDDYVSVRSIWDKYLSDEPHSSSIPVGWVVPVKPSSSDWAKYLPLN